MQFLYKGRFYGILPVQLVVIPFWGVVSQRELDELSFVIWENSIFDIRVYQFFSNIRNSDDQWWFHHLYLLYFNLNNSFTKCYTKVDGICVQAFYYMLLHLLRYKYITYGNRWHLNYLKYQLCYIYLPLHTKHGFVLATVRIMILQEELEKDPPQKI